jgi:hypothetical protein
VDENLMIREVVPWENEQREARQRQITEFERKGGDLALKLSKLAK